MGSKEGEEKTQPSRPDSVAETGKSISKLRSSHKRRKTSQSPRTDEEQATARPKLELCADKEKECSANAKGNALAPSGENPLKVFERASIVEQESVAHKDLFGNQHIESQSSFFSRKINRPPALNIDMIESQGIENWISPSYALDKSPFAREGSMVMISPNMGTEQMLFVSPHARESLLSPSNIFSPLGSAGQLVNWAGTPSVRNGFFNVFKGGVCESVGNGVL